MAQHQTVQHPMGADEFFKWLEKQDKRYELVDGKPLLMAGANIAHDTIVMNGSRVFGNQLLNTHCRPRSADIAIKIPAGNIRYPDLSVDCGTPGSSDKSSDKPTLVVEVASKSTQHFDDVDKLEEYKSVPSMEYILLVAADGPRVRFYYRDEIRVWQSRAIIGMDSRIEMAIIGVSITLGDLYHGLQFDDGLDSIDA
ncbi:Uma2 family endonuclease [Propionivibrio sp.]|uniref:Uma2 family endonuclease n=1 Tax=Propionivibrio sp. TaxID=2212460 RepID=UPI003BF09E27